MSSIFTIKNVLGFGLICGLSISLVQANHQVTQLLNSEVEQHKKINELTAMLFNTKLEKIDYIETEKVKISNASENEKEELSQKSLRDIKNKFHEVEYVRNEHSEIIGVNFNDLDINCETYNKFRAMQIEVFANAKIINQNCDEVTK